MVKMAKSMDPEMAAGIASYAFPFLWAENSELAITTMAELKARGGEEFENSFEEEIFVGQLH